MRTSSGPLGTIDPEPLGRLPGDLVLIVELDQQAGLEPGANDLARLHLALCRGKFTHHLPRGAGRCLRSRGVEGFVTESGIDHVQNLVEQFAVETCPCIWRAPPLEGLHFITVWVKLARIVQPDADELEPGCWAARSGDVQLAAIEADVVAAIVF